jgi:hypothetical protein
MRNLTLTVHFCDISQPFVSATKYKNTSRQLVFISRFFLQPTVTLLYTILNICIVQFLPFCDDVII